MPLSTAERSRSYAIRHPDRVKQKASRFYNTASGRFVYLKARCKKEKIEFLFDKNSFQEWWDSQNRECDYCEVKESEMNSKRMNFNRRVFKLSFDRKDPTKGYSPQNVVLACYRCNSIKGDFFSYEEMKKIAEMFIKPKL